MVLRKQNVCVCVCVCEFKSSLLIILNKYNSNYIYKLCCVNLLPTICGIHALTSGLEYSIYRYCTAGLSDFAECCRQSGYTNGKVFIDSNNIMRHIYI